jgi:catechol 2,3-dioxygenase
MLLGLISQLAHVELQSPRPDESVDFFTRVLGMTETDRDGRAVYLRAWGDPFHHSVVVSEGAYPRVAHIAWRSAGAEALETAVGRLEQAGAAEGWVDPVLGHGRAFRYRSPGGHVHELFWDVDRYVAPPEERSTFPIRSQRFYPVGAAVRQIDHVTIATPRVNEDVAFYRDVLGSRFMECTVTELDDPEPFFVEMTNTEQAHDLGLLKDHSGLSGRSHHFAFWVDQPTEVMRAADVLLEAGVAVEYGPGKHGHGENTFLYTREPGGHRVELFSGGYRNYQPDWEPVRWVVGSGGIDMFRNWPAPESMLEVFPPAEAPTASIIEDDTNPWSIVGVS